MPLAVQVTSRFPFNHGAPIHLGDPSAIGADLDAPLFGGPVPPTPKDTVPVISASTQSRPEGYFRLEWKLAVDRSHLLADDHPFIFPVVIDETTESAARVPERFRDFQWSRHKHRCAD